MVLAIWLTRPSYCSTDARHPLSGVVKSADRRMYFDAEVADDGAMVMADAAPGGMRTASTEISTISKWSGGRAILLPRDVALSDRRHGVSAEWHREREGSTSSSDNNKKCTTARMLWSPNPDHRNHNNDFHHHSHDSCASSISCGSATITVAPPTVSVANIITTTTTTTILTASSRSRNSRSSSGGRSSGGGDGGSSLSHSNYKCHDAYAADGNGSRYGSVQSPFCWAVLPGKHN